jgi:hypothetical protein
MSQNSNEVQWQDSFIYLNGAKITKVAGWDYRTVQDKQFLHAAGVDPAEIRRGQKSYAGNLQLFKNAIDDIRRAVKLAGLSEIVDADFMVVFNYLPSGARLGQTDTLFGLQFTEDPRTASNSNINGSITVPFMAVKIKST